MLRLTLTVVVNPMSLLLVMKLF